MEVLFIASDQIPQQSKQAEKGSGLKIENECSVVYYSGVGCKKEDYSNLPDEGGDRRGLIVDLVTERVVFEEESVEEGEGSG